LFTSALYLHISTKYFAVVVVVVVVDVVIMKLRHIICIVLMEASTMEANDENVGGDKQKINCGSLLVLRFFSFGI